MVTSAKAVYEINVIPIIIVTFLIKPETRNKLHIETQDWIAPIILDRAKLEILQYRTLNFTTQQK